jgi:iron complex outermembrane receptor protein
MHFHAPSLLAAAIAVASLNAVAADATTTDRQTQAPLSVIVTGTRFEQPAGTAPGQVDVISRAQIEASGAQSVVEALRASGAVQISQNYTGNPGDGVVSMRGFGENVGQNVLILVDGRPLNTPSLQPPNLAAISLAEVERIEVLHGSAGVLYGQRAVGGVINIITRDIEGSRGEIGISAGSYDRSRTQGRFSHRDDSGLGISVAADRERTDGYRDNSDTAFDQASASLSWRHDSGEIGYSHERINNNQRLPGALSRAQVDSDRRQSDRPDDYFNEDIRLDRLFIDQSLSDHLEFSADWSQRDANGIGYSLGADNIQNLRIESLTPRLQGSWQLPTGALLLTTGFDLTDSDYQADNALVTTDITQDTEAAYLRLQLPLQPRWSLTLGARHSEVEDRDLNSNLSHDDSVFVKEFGITWRPSDQQRIFLRRDENFRFATADENGSTLPGIEFLDPQEGVSWELGWGWSGATSRIEATLFDLSLDNEILYDAAQFANINLDSSRRRGLILSAEHQLTPALRIGGTYTYTHSEMTSGSFEGNEVPYVANNQFSLFSNYRFNRQWNLYTDLQYTGSRYPAWDDANRQERLDPDLLLNASLRWQQGPWSAQLTINNLLDEEYHAYAGYASWKSSNYYYPAPERNLLLSLGYTF